MNTAKSIAAIALACLLFGCGNSGTNKEAYSNEMTALADSSAKSISISADGNKAEPKRQFIRTADLKFRVNDVMQSTYNIESITKENNGFVTNTQLASNIDNTVTTPVSTDSSLETTYYTVTNSITLRVPDIRLDTSLKVIAKEVDFLDTRTITAEDVTLQIMAAKLAAKRSLKAQKRLTTAIDSKGKKLKEIVEAEQVLSGGQQNGDESLIENLSLTDQVHYSTLTISIYQRQRIIRTVLSNFKNINAYKPGLGSRIWESLQSGWEMTVDLIAFFTRFWLIILCVGVVLVVYRRLKK